MKVLYLSCFLNHHQKPLADVMYDMLGDDYKFVETTDFPKDRLQLGYEIVSAPYVLKYNPETKDYINQMILDADVVIYGEAPIGLVKKRLRKGKFTFRDDECRYRNISRFLKWPVYTYKSLYLNRGYMLCASAYGPIDYLLSGFSPSKCYKWGYFTEVKRYDSINHLMEQKHYSKQGEVMILWVGRFIPLKHPEYAVYVADMLKKAGYSFKMKMIGSGRLENRIKRMIRKKNLSENIFVVGAMPHREVRRHMEEADIFLFTSDRNEGWGAVLNESMNSCCSIVADSNIGSVPYLIKDGVNGMIYKSTNKKNLYEKVKYLMDNKDKMREIGKEAYQTMLDTWNPKTAANNLISLCDALLAGKMTPIENGPCSSAPLIMRTWKGRIKTI